MDYLLYENTRSIRIVKYQNYSDIKSDKPTYSLFKSKTVNDEHIRHDQKHKIYFPFMSGKLKIEKEFYAETNEDISKYYNNPFTRTIVTKKVRSLKKDNNRLILTLYEETKTRNVNNKFFKKRHNIYKLAFHINTGNIYCIRKNNIWQPPINEIRCNNIKTISSTLSKIIFINPIPKIEKDEEMVNNFNDKLYLKTFYEHLNINLNDDMSLKISLHDWFINKKNIKVPNDYIELLRLYPTEKYLKKNDRKLVKAILDRGGIKSKKANKILNIYPTKYTYDYLCVFIKIFGVEFLNKLYLKAKENNIFNVKDHYYNYFTNANNKIENNNINGSFLKHNEKNALLKIALYDTISYRGYELIIDHISMVKEIYELSGERHKIKFKNSTEFRNQHGFLTNELRRLNKNREIIINYDINAINKIEEPITTKNDVFKPIVLKTETDYRMESKIMHHCVSSYVTYENSIIVSLKRNNEDAITIEYDVINGENIQSRYICNKSVPENFNKALSLLNKKMLSLGKKKLLKRISTKKEIKNNNIIEETTPEYVEFDEQYVEFEEKLW